MGRHNKKKSILADRSSGVPDVQAPSQSRPLLWYCQLDGRGEDIIDQWETADVTVRGRANFERVRDHLRWQPYRDWHRPHGEKVRGHHHIFVIHFHDETGKQWRVFGYADATLNGFVMTNTAFEKDDKYHPRDSADRASKYRDMAYNGSPEH